MIVDDQREIIDLLSTPATYGPGVTAVERIDTHSATVFLVGGRGYKLKRAVRYDYLDFSTPEKRHAACEAELRLNRRTAPHLYLGVLPVTREGGGRLALGGGGAALEWLVQMARFDQEMLFDRLAARRALEIELMTPLAAAIARFHAGAERRIDQGGQSGMAWVIEGNAAGLAEYGRDMVDPDACEQMTGLARAALERHGDRLNARRNDGFVRVCHGDLHLRNIVLTDGRPTLFDAVEFNDRIACVDVLYDLAFLIIDLWRLGLRAHANTLFNAYLERTDELRALALMPLFLSCRSAVRAKTNATAARMQADAVRIRELEAAARQYLARAQEFLRPEGAQLVAIGGVSGTGKSALAHRLASTIGPAPGAVVLRSDVIRKALFGAPATARLGPEGYTHTITQEVYQRLARHAAEVLEAGHAVIVDAVFGRPAQRTAMADVARTVAVPFTGLWLEAPVDVLMTRIQARRADASDATVEVLREQLQRDEGSIDWVRVDASGDLDRVQRRAESVLTRANRERVPQRNR